jgi:hypothetical protein
MANRELLTHTKRMHFQNCPRYFYHRHEQHLELISKRAGRRRGAIFGDALQAARDQAEALKDTPPEQMPEPDSTFHPVQVAQLSIEAAYDAIGPDTQAEVDELVVEQAKMEVMVAAYLERYGYGPRREVEFYLPLFNPYTGGRSRSFDLAGKLDGLTVIGDKRARIIEDKLMAQIQKAMIDRLPLDSQSSEYVDALAIRGWSADVAYRHTRWPGINPTKEKIPPEFTPSGAPSKAKYVPPESIPDFKDRLANDVASRIDFYFDEQIVFYPVEHLDDYRAGRYGVAIQIMNARRLEKTAGFHMAYPMNPSRCWEYGGCEFIPLCTKQPDAIHRYQVVQDNAELSGGAVDTYGNESS